MDATPPQMPTKGARKTMLCILHLPPPHHGAAAVGELIRTSTRIHAAADMHFLNLSTSTTGEDIGRLSLRKISQIVQLYRRVAQRLRQLQPDAVYLTLSSHGFGFLKDYPILWLAKRLKVPVYLHFHNKGVARYADKWPYRLLYPKAFRDTTVLLLGEALYDDVQRFVRPEQVRYLPNGIPQPELPADSLPKTPRIRPEDPFQLLFLSNLFQFKGPLLLLDALALLAAKGLPIHAHFMGKAGDISEAAFTAAIAERQLTEHVTYHGACYGEEKYRIFAAMDLLVHPTSDDCQPLVILEAFALGIPVLSTAVGAIPSMLHEGNGRIVAQNAAEIAAEIENLSKNPELCANLGRQAKMDFEKRYTIPIFEDNFLKSLRLP
ncbi:MAG: glycosyltransferase family 4 protein [Nitritalea sp.]